MPPHLSEEAYWASIGLKAIYKYAHYHKLNCQTAYTN